MTGQTFKGQGTTICQARAEARRARWWPQERRTGYQGPGQNNLVNYGR
jgi:hypothetical protein